MAGPVMNFFLLRSIKLKLQSDLITNPINYKAN